MKRDITIHGFLKESYDDRKYDKDLARAPHFQSKIFAFSLQKLSCDFADVSLVYEDGLYLQGRTR